MRDADDLQLPKRTEDDDHHGQCWYGCRRGADGRVPCAQQEGQGWEACHQGRITAHDLHTVENGDGIWWSLGDVASKPGCVASGASPTIEFHLPVLNMGACPQGLQGASCQAGNGRCSNFAVHPTMFQTPSSNSQPHKQCPSLLVILRCRNCRPHHRDRLHPRRPGCPMDRICTTPSPLSAEAQ